jgi:hypothetical protein
MNQRIRLLIPSIILGISIIMVILPTTITQAEVVQNQPNIEIFDITFSKSEPIEGEEISIFIEIKNNGVVSVQDLTITIYVDSESITNITNIIIEGSDSEIVESKWSSEGGTHIISAMASINNIPVTRELYSEEITVTIGDIPSLLISFLIIGMVILIIAISPSMVNRPKRTCSKSDNEG